MKAPTVGVGIEDANVFLPIRDVQKDLPHFPEANDRHSAFFIMYESCKKSSQNCNMSHAGDKKKNARRIMPPCVRSEQLSFRNGRLVSRQVVRLDCAPSVRSCSRVG